MLRTSHLPFCSVLAALVVVGAAHQARAELVGHYLEARTCQVYTGPCFANGEVGLTGKDAVMAWNIRQGEQDGVDLSGLNVVVVVRSDRTLGFRGMEDAGKLESVVLVDGRATPQQRKALVEFVSRHSGKAGKHIARVVTAPIALKLDEFELTGELTAGDSIHLATRKARETDCICSNESAYYPPLVQVEYFAPGVAEEGYVSARAIGTSWSIPGARSTYMATFSYE